jgi:hypothetical protein
VVSGVSHQEFWDAASGVSHQEFWDAVSGVSHQEFWDVESGVSHQEFPLVSLPPHSANNNKVYTFSISLIVSVNFIRFIQFISSN